MSGFLKRLTYKIISNPDVARKGGATFKDVVKSVFSKPQQDDNKYMFIYGPDKLGRSPEDQGQGYDYGYNNSYKGVLNPYNEYLFNERDRGLVEELAKHKWNTSSNINTEYSDPTTERIVENTPYFDDVHGYNLQFHLNENGDPVISASDSYDFDPEYGDRFANVYAERNDTKISTDKAKRRLNSQAKLLNLVGNPYILRQNNIPIRFTDNPQGNEIHRVNNISRFLLDNYSDEDYAKILGTGYIEPAIIKSK